MTGLPFSWPRATIWLRRGPVRFRIDVRTAVVCALLAIATIGVTVAALCLGDYRISPAELLSLAGGNGPEMLHTVVFQWRLPRALGAVILGAALGLSGAVFQALTRNPLASPDIIGFSSGSYTGALIAALVLGVGSTQMATGAVIGGMATAMVVFFIAYRRGVQGFRLIVVGIAISAMLSSFNAYLMLTSRLEQAMQAAAWGAGTLSAVDMKSLGTASVFVVIAVVIIGSYASRLHQLELGDDVSIAHGVPVRATWIALVTAGVMLIAVVTAVCGPIAFVALAAPQVARRMVGGAGAPLTASAFLAALLLSGSDLIGQHALERPLPVGLVTLVIGGLYLAWLLAFGRR